MVNEDISSPYKLQAIVSAIKIQKLAFFEIRYSFVDENTNNIYHTTQLSKFYRLINTTQGNS